MLNEVISGGYHVLYIHTKDYKSSYTSPRLLWPCVCKHRNKQDHVLYSFLNYSREKQKDWSNLFPYRHRGTHRLISLHRQRLRKFPRVSFLRTGEKHSSGAICPAPCSLKGHKISFCMILKFNGFCVASQAVEKTNILT